MVNESTASQQVSTTPFQLSSAGSGEHKYFFGPFDKSVHNIQQLWDFLNLINNYMGNSLGQSQYNCHELIWTTRKFLLLLIIEQIDPMGVFLGEGCSKQGAFSRTPGAE